MPHYSVEKFEVIATQEEFNTCFEDYLKFINSTENGNKKLEETLKILDINDLSPFRLDIAYTTAISLAGENAARFFFQVIRKGFRDLDSYPAKILHELVPLFAKYNQLLTCIQLYSKDPMCFAGVDILSTSEQRNLLRFQRADSNNLTVSIEFEALVYLTEVLIDRVIESVQLYDQELNESRFEGFYYSLDALNRLVGDVDEPAGEEE